MWSRISSSAPRNGGPPSRPPPSASDALNGTIATSAPSLSQRRWGAEPSVGSHLTGKPEVQRPRVRAVGERYGASVGVDHFGLLADEWSAAWGDRTALIVDDQQWSYAELGTA